MSDGRLLDGVTETLLIPLWARAEESLRPDGLIRDPWAVRLRDAMDFDFNRLSAGWKTQLGIAIRTWLVDREVTAYLARHPGGTVVTLGCGLDARSLRMDNGLARWFDLDLPDAIALRGGWFPSSDRHHPIAASALDQSWLNMVPTDPPPLFIAEGLFMYLPEADLRNLLSAMAERFPGAVLLAEIMSRALAVGTVRHDVISQFDTNFQSGLDDGREFERWHPAIRLTAQWSHVDFCHRRWRWLGWLGWLPFVRRAARICRLTFQDTCPIGNEDASRPAARLTLTSP